MGIYRSLCNLSNPLWKQWTDYKHFMIKMLSTYRKFWLGCTRIDICRRESPKITVPMFCVQTLMRVRNTWLGGTRSSLPVPHVIQVYVDEHQAPSLQCHPWSVCPLPRSGATIRWGARHSDTGTSRKCHQACIALLACPRPPPCRSIHCQDWFACLPTTRRVQRIWMSVYPCTLIPLEMSRTVSCQWKVKQRAFVNSWCNKCVRVLSRKYRTNKCQWANNNPASSWAQLVANHCSREPISQPQRQVSIVIIATIAFCYSPIRWAISTEPTGKCREWKSRGGRLSWR